MHMIMRSTVLLCIIVASGFTGSTFAALSATPLDDWTFVHPHGPLSPWGSVAYGNGRYVVVTGDPARPQFLWSSNAVDWMPSATNFPYQYGKVVFAHGKFLAAGGGDDDRPPAVFLTSSNGEDW